MINKNWLPALFSILILMSFNLLMVSSLAPTYLFRQILAWLIGIILFFVGKQINPKMMNTSKWPIFIVCCLLLATPIALNNITRGSRRWIDIGFTSIQPSEIVKPWLMINLANSNHPLFHLIPIGIVMAQPDLGSAISIFFLMIPIILFNKKFFKISLILGMIVVITSPIIYKYVLHDYQKNRIINFINPNHDPLGKGYNVIQSKIAIGSGGLWGKGYRKGTQGQLLFLPEKHTDFMFSATAEELGLLGIIILLASYYILINTLIKKAFSFKNKAAFIFTLGIVMQIWLQTVVNIGMNIGLLPVTGIPLPFISVGGSSLISYLFSLGIIYST